MPEQPQLGSLDSPHSVWGDRVETRDAVRMIAEQLGNITKRLDQIEEKLDTYTLETIQLKTDVSWIKGSAKMGLTLVITAVGAVIAAFVKLIPIMK